MLLILMLEGGFFKNKDFFCSRAGLRGAYQHFCGDLTFRRPYPMLGGEYSALGLQTMLLGFAEEYFAGKDYEFLNDEISWQLVWWRKILDCASGPDPMHALFSYSDHAKYCLIEGDMRRLGYSWTDAPDKELVIPRKNTPAEKMTVRGRLNWWNLEYHRISHTYGIFQEFPLERVCTDSEIAHAIHYAPSNTRAFARRTAIDIFEEHYPQSRTTTADWGCVIGWLPGGHSNFQCTLNDPFESQISRSITKPLDG
jgi:hypothetical protein